MIDVPAYLDRIGLEGPVEPTLTDLNRILLAHVRTVPFENIDVLTGRPISVEPEDVELKVVGEGRGGYCFELNGLLIELLAATGFEVAPLSGRARHPYPRTEVRPRTHLFARVVLDGTPWLADVGMGPNSPTGAVRMDTDLEQRTPHESQRLVRAGAVTYLQTRLGAQWRDVHEFTGEEMPHVDRVVANWYTSTHPNSHFKDRLVVARALEDGARLSLLNRTRTLRRADGSADERTLASAAELFDVLASDFGITIPAGSELVCPGLAWDTAD